MSPSAKAKDNKRTTWKEFLHQLEEDKASWEKEGLCRNMAPEVFYGGDSDKSTLTALLCCQRCPVRPSCLEYAVANDESYGVWGGTTERERRRLRRQWTHQDQQSLRKLVAARLNASQQSRQSASA